MAVRPEKIYKKPFMHLYRRVIMYAMVALLLTGMFVYYFEKSFVERAQDEYNSLCNAAQTEIDTKNANEQLLQVAQALLRNGAATRFRIGVLEYKNIPFTEKTLAEFAQSFGSDHTFYFISDLTEFSCPKGYSCPLTEAQAKLLVRRGSMLEGDYCYFGASMLNGTLVMQVKNEQASDAVNLTAFYSCDVLTYDTDTGEITDVYGGELETELLGKNFADVAFYPSIGEKIVRQEGFQLLIFTPEEGVFPNFSKMVLAVRNTENAADGYQKVFYLPLSYVILSAQRMISVPILMMLLFAWISVHSSVYFRRRWEESRIRGREIRLGKRLRIDSSVAKNTLFVEACFFVLVLAFGLFVQSLADFASLYGDAQIHLNGLTETMEQNQKVYDYIQEQFESALLKNTDSVADYLSQETDPEEIDSYLQQIKTIIGAEEISVYDENGIIQYSTSSYKGYQISQMEQDAEYRLWELINGERDSLFYEADDETGLYCCAVRRKDGIGIVAVEKTDTQVRMIKDRVDVDHTALNTDFETSDKLFVSSDEPNVLYRIPAGESTAETISSRLPVLEDLQDITAIRVIERKAYFVCGLGYSGVSIYNADPVSPIVSNTLKMGRGMLIVCAAISFFVLLGTCIYTGGALLPTDDDTVHMTKKEIEKVQRGSLYNGWIASASLAGLFLVLDSVFSEESILDFLLFGNWEKGANIFAFSMTILALVGVYFFNRLLRIFFRMLCRNLPTYSVTICEMLNSILTLGIYLWLLIFSLMQFGVDTATIIAGIGISGLAISFAAKGTVEDLLSGIFLIVDGRIRVGDFIKVGDNEGEVTHIGIRTTKIQRWNKEICINNSDMRDFVNCSRGDFYAAVFFIVPFGTDLDRLQQIIEGSAKRFMKKGDGLLLNPPAFCGSCGFRFNGVRIQLLVRTSPDMESAAERAVYSELTDILKENEIPIRG